MIAHINDLLYNEIKSYKIVRLILQPLTFHYIYRVVQKRPILFFISKLSFTNFFHIFQVVQTAGLGDYFDTNMDPTRRFTTQQPTKIIKAYFAISSLTQRQCRGDFGRDNVPDRKTIQRLVAKFRETGSVADAQQSLQWPTSFKLFKSNKPRSFSII